jgi:hypothetical protein
MKSALMLLLSATLAVAGFMPNVRVDHDDRPDYFMRMPAIALGPGAPSSQPLYVVFQRDSGSPALRSDVMFQRSTDGGRTWLPADVLIRRGEGFATYPDITTGSDGDVFVVYKDGSTGHRHICIVRSSDGGATWSAPVNIVDNDSASVVASGRIAAAAGGNLFYAWHEGPVNRALVYSSVSTDKGATWSPHVCVDSTNDNCFHEDVCIQPGTNHYLVVASVPRPLPPSTTRAAWLYRSTDMGRTFMPGVRLDTSDFAYHPHAVADSDHIICEYNVGGRTEARTFHTQADSWGMPSPVADLGIWYESSGQGDRLALSADGRVHAVLTAHHRDSSHAPAYYAFSSDHGVTWSERELVSDDTTEGHNTQNPDIGADSAGHVYVIWEDWRSGRGRIWFATNYPVGVAEQPRQRGGAQSIPTVVRRLPSGSVAFDAMGRRVLRPKPGIYFLRTTTTAAPRKVLLVE